MLYRGCESAPRHRLFPLRKQRRCDGRPTAGRTCRIARPPLNLDLEVRLAEIYLAISHDGHSILLHLGNPAYPHVSVPKDLLTVRVSMKGSLNLARLTHVLPDDMTMLFASSNPREIHIPTTCSQRKKLCLVLKKLTFIE
jgi:hypothetical protein